MAQTLRSPTTTPGPASTYQSSNKNSKVLHQIRLFHSGNHLPNYHVNRLRTHTTYAKHTIFYHRICCCMLRSSAILLATNAKDAAATHCTNTTNAGERQHRKEPSSRTIGVVTHRPSDPCRRRPRQRFAATGSAETSPRTATRHHARGLPTPTGSGQRRRQ